MGSIESTDGTTGGSVVHNLYGNVNTKGIHIGSTGGMDQLNAALAIGLNQKSQKKDERSTGRLNSFESSRDASNRKGSGPQGTFTNPKGDGQTFLNVFTGKAQIDKMVTVVKQDDTRDTAGDTFLKKTEVNQYDVVVQQVPGARGNIVGAVNHGEFRAKRLCSTVTDDLSIADPSRNPQPDPFEDPFFTDE